MVNGMLFERRQCKELMERFLKTSAPYTDAFLKRRENAIVRSWRKVTWLYQKDEINKLDRDMQEHMRAMQVYADALFQNQMASHTEAKDSQFQRLFSSVVDMRTDISAISNSLQTSQSRFPRSLGYPWEASSDLAENVLLLDANGRSLLLPMLFLSSPKQFHELLDIMYREIPGHRKILRKEYTITDEESDGVLVKESDWNRVVRAGIQLSLNIILEATSTWKTHCPRCEERTPGHALPGKRRRCHKCQLTYCVFEHEKIVEQQKTTTSSPADSSTSLQQTQTEPSVSLQVKERKDEAYIREEYYFKRVHYYSEIQILKPVSAIVAVEQEPRVLKVEELPPLHRAAASGALALLEELLDTGEKIDQPLPFEAILKKSDTKLYFGGCSPLHLAAFFGKAKVIERLLDRGANISAKDLSDTEPLYYTLTGENHGVSMLLLSRRADPNSRNQYRHTFLHEVFQRGITWLFYPLTEYGADFTAPAAHGSNALHIAAHCGHMELVETILKQNVADSLMTALDGFGGTPFHRAAWNGCVDIALVLLDRGADPSQRLTDNRTLHLAAYQGDYDVAKLLLERKCAIEQDEDKETPLHSACWERRSERVVELLLANGADPSHRDSKKRTPLQIASSKGIIATVKKLLNHGADLGSEGGAGVTPLHEASWTGHIDVVKLLLEAGAMISAVAKDVLGLTPLLSALLGGHEEVAKLLLSRGADVLVQDKYGDTPLHYAAQTGKNELITMIAERGVDFNIKCHNSRSSLYNAAEHNHVEAVRALLRHGADIHTRNSQARTPLHTASWLGHSEVVELLLKSGADASFEDKDGDTPLHEASFQNSVRVVEVLLDHGTDVNAQNKFGHTPLHFASRQGHLEVADILLRRGANVDSKNQQGTTPLQQAARWGKGKAIEFLLDHGADLETRDKWNMTPLLDASSEGQFEAVKELLRKKATATATDIKGLTPLHQASLNGHLSIVQDLVKHSPVDATSALGRTSYAIACRKGHASVAKFLLESGANISTLDSQGLSALHHAACEITRQLLKCCSRWASIRIPKIPKETHHFI